MNYRTCLEILRMNPYILIMDCTYKANNMPLLDIIGITATSATFFVGLGFMSSKHPMISSCEAWDCIPADWSFITPDNYDRQGQSIAQSDRGHVPNS